MNHAKVNVPKDKKVRKKLYEEALLSSFEFWVDELDVSKSFRRQRIDDSFSLVLHNCLNDKSTHWVILFRDKVVSDDVEHYEFGASTMTEKPTQFLWIKVSVEDAERLFKRYKLKINKY